MLRPHDLISSGCGQWDLAQEINYIFYRDLKPIWILILDTDENHSWTHKHLKKKVLQFWESSGADLDPVCIVKLRREPLKKQ